MQCCTSDSAFIVFDRASFRRDGNCEQRLIRLSVILGQRYVAMLWESSVLLTRSELNWRLLRYHRYRWLLDDTFSYYTPADDILATLDVWPTPIMSDRGSNFAYASYSFDKKVNFLIIWESLNLWDDVFAGEDVKLDIKFAVQIIEP
jgi:hypothetical protein